MKECIPIILGADENAYGCAVMFGKVVKEKPIVLCAKGLTPTSHSRILSRRVIDDFDHPSVFSRVLYDTLASLKNEAEKLLVISCSDYYTELLADCKGRLGHLISNPIPSKELLCRTSAKSEFAKLCAEQKVNHPKTETVIPSAVLGQKKNRNYPVVLKPSNSNGYEYLHSTIEGKRKVYFCKDEAELEKSLESFVLSGCNKPCVIQEYIEGGCESMRVINAYCDSNAKVRLIGAAQPIVEYRNDRMIGNYAALRSVKDRALCDEAGDFLEKIGYVGFANMDIKISPVTGKNVFFELNPRQGRSSYYMYLAGGNLMKAVYDDVVRNVPYSGRSYAEGECVWINEPSAVLKRELYTRGERNISSSMPAPATALTLFPDFSPARAITLAHRYIGAFSREI